MRALCFEGAIDPRSRRPPSETSVVAANENLKLVFGDEYPQRTAKQVMAWDWPCMDLTGDALQHYEGSYLGQHQRDTARLLEAALHGAQGGAETFTKMVGTPSRFMHLKGDLDEAAKMLGTVIREGVIVWMPGIVEADGEMVQRDGLELLFQTIASTRGKDGDGFKMGDPFNVELFDPLDDGDGDEDGEGEEVEVTVPGGENLMVDLDAQGSFLYHLKEATLMKAIREIEKTLPAKQTVFVAAKGHATARVSGSNMKLSRSSRECVIKLKRILPISTVAQLKKFHKEAGLLNPPDDKDDLVKELVGWLLPSYPYEDPWGKPENGEAFPETVAEEVVDGADD